MFCLSNWGSDTPMHKGGGGWSRFEEGCITFEMLVHTSWRCQEEGWLLESAAEDQH